MAGPDDQPTAAQPKVSPRISRANIGAPVLQTGPEDLGAMPDKEELERQFRVLMESMNVSPEHEKDLMGMPDDRKWKLIRNDMQRRILAALPAEYFCDQLRRHLDTGDKKKSKKAKSKGLEPSFDLLKKLEVLLRTTASSWVEEFVDHPNNGHMLILEFMSDLPVAAHQQQQQRAAPTRQRSPGEHHLCVLCIRALMRHDYAFRKIVSEPGYINLISLSIRNENLRTRVAALQMLALTASDPSGGVMITLDAMHYFSNVVGEQMRFFTLMEMLEDPEQPQEFQLAAMQLVTNMVNHAPDLNTLVYIQADLARAGLFRLLESLGTSSNADIRKLAREYRNKLVNVDSIVQSREENYQLYHETVDQVNAMQETLESVTQQRDELRQLHKEAQLKATELQGMLNASKKEREQLAGKLAQVTDLLVEQQELVASTQLQLKETEEQHRMTAEQLASLAKRKGGFAPNVPIQQQLAETSKVDTLQSIKSVQSTHSDKAAAPAGAAGAPEHPPAPSMPAPDIPVPPPLMTDSIFAPPAPPPPGQLADGYIPPPPLMNAGYAPPGMKPKRRIQPNVPLPMLNWVPLRKVNDTIFAELDDENVLAEMDFKQFEQQFKVRDMATKLPTGSNEKEKKRITLVESNRARNLVITCRRIDLPYDELRHAVDGTDLVSLPPELAELLINYIPTDEEITVLKKHEKEKDRLNEAERFMLEVLPIERYESKLRIMAYIGYFDEIYLTVQPQIEAVLKASEALVTSLAFRKVLEIILAFGNYMNSAKRGPAYGFKLPTFERLLDTKSTDRRITLLDFVAQTVENHYPQIALWYEELVDLEQAARVSMVTLTTDVQGLRKGMDLILYEREKQQQNFVVHCFYASAVSKVSRVTERYRLMTERYNEVCTLFNESATTMEPFDFFSVFERFVNNYKKAVADNKHRLELAEREAMREAETQDTASKPAAKNNNAKSNASAAKPQGKKKARQAGMDVELPPHPILMTTSKRPF